MVFAITAAIATGAAGPGRAAAGILPMRMAMASATTISLARGREMAGAVAADMDAAPRAAVETVSGVGAAGNKRNHYAQRAGDH